MDLKPVTADNRQVGLDKDDGASSWPARSQGSGVATSMRQWCGSSRPEADIRWMSASAASVEVQIVQGTGGLARSLLDMCVDHRRFEVAVTQQQLNRSDIGPSS